MGHQSQITLVTGGRVESLDRQATVDEGHNETAISGFFQTVNQADVAIVYTDANHRLATYSDEVIGFGTLFRFQAFGALFVHSDKENANLAIYAFPVFARFPKIIYSNNAECGEI